MLVAKRNHIFHCVVFFFFVVFSCACSFYFVCFLLFLIIFPRVEAAIAKTEKHEDKKKYDSQFF